MKKELTTTAISDIPDDLKPYITLDDFTKEGTVHHETKKPGRNDPCICSSGKKYKKCCWE